MRCLLSFNLHGADVKLIRPANMIEARAVGDLDLLTHILERRGVASLVHHELALKESEHVQRLLVLRQHTCSSIETYTCSSIETYTCSSIETYTCSSIEIYTCSSTEIYTCSSIETYTCSSTEIYTCSSTEIV
jgi:hypothetical protein